MMKGDYVIFKGPHQGQRRQDGDRRGRRRRSRPIRVLEQMNYLVEGVIGKV